MRNPVMATDQKGFQSARIGIFHRRMLGPLAAWSGYLLIMAVARLWGIVVVMAHTEDAETLHLISMRKAEKHEQRLYFVHCGR